MLFLVAGGVVAAATAATPAFPSTLLVRHGYDGAQPNDTCCGSFLAGWGPGGAPVTFSSSWVGDEDAFRYALEIHQPGEPQPKELFSVRFFRDDDSLPFACQGGGSLLACAWETNADRIRKAFARAKAQPSKEQSLLALPPYSMEWTNDPLADGDGVPFSFSDSGGELRFRLVDTDAVALHLVPVALIKTRTPHGRLILLRLARREQPGESMQDLGVRFLRLPEASATGKRR
jgi:hypothetical protein